MPHYSARAQWNTANARLANKPFDDLFTYRDKMPDDHNPEPAKDDQPVHPLPLEDVEDVREIDAYQEGSLRRVVDKCMCKCGCKLDLTPSDRGGICLCCFHGSHAPRKMTVKK